MLKINKRKVLVTAVVIYMLYAMAKSVDAGSYMAEAAKQGLLRFTAPAFICINNEEFVQQNVTDKLLGDIYPAKEYMLIDSFEVSEAGDLGDETVYVTGSKDYDYGTTADYEIYEESTKQSVESSNNTAVITDDTDKKDGKEVNGEPVDDIKDVISNNVVTGKTYSYEKLCDYTFSKSLYTVTGITNLTDDIFRPGEFLKKDLSIVKDDSKPQILIYHTHSQETFADSVTGDDSTSIVGVGDYLTKLLTDQYGYNVIHDRGVYDLVDGKLDRSRAYDYSQEAVRQMIEKYPSIEVVIDLHRDGLPENMHLVTDIAGKKVAKVMLFNGISYSNVNGELTSLPNPFRDDNLATSLQLRLLGDAYYPNFLRNNYINAYRYGLHNKGRSMLIEAGAQTNTFDEVKNAMEPLADIIDKLLSGKKAY